MNIQPYKDTAAAIEECLALYKAPVMVSKIHSFPTFTTFYATLNTGIPIAKVQSNATNLAIALGVANVRISHYSRFVVIQVPKEDAQPRITCSGLLQGKPLKPNHALLGLTENGTILTLNFGGPDTPHAMVSGTTGSGKTELMNTIMMTLAQSTKKGVEFVFVDPKRRVMSDLDRIMLPYMRLKTSDLGIACDALTAIVKEMRAKTVGPVTKRTVIAIDELADMAQQGGPEFLENIRSIAQYGRELGYHLLLGTQKPSAGLIGPILKANIPLRLTGRVMNATDSNVATGIRGVEAHKLNGRGDFVAVATKQIRFQAALAV